MLLLYACNAFHSPCDSSAAVCSGIIARSLPFPLPQLCQGHRWDGGAVVLSKIIVLNGGCSCVSRCAVFPLQLLGFHVDPINSVQFSNHTGYRTFRGAVLQGEELWALIEGLQENDLLSGYSHVLTGYIGSASFLQAVLRTLRTLRAANPSIEYYCDPVMGDNDKLYVPEELVAIYREAVVPLATVLTPNQFEAEQLTGCRITDEAEAAAACRLLHERGPHTVVITSLSLANRPDQITMLASRRDSEGVVRQWRLCLPSIPRHFTGTGDLTAALLLAWSHRHPEPEQLSLVLEKVGATLQSVLANTMSYSKIASNGRSEISLIESQAELREPQVRVSAEPLEGAS